MAVSAVAEEEVRELETFRYDSSLINIVFPEGNDTAIFSSELTPDPALTAFAQLGVLRLDSCRALVSLFDNKHQYIVAEATPKTLLSAGTCAAQRPTGRDGLGDRLLIWGTSVPRASSICEDVLLSSSRRETRGANTSLVGRTNTDDNTTTSTTSSGDLPVIIVGDLADYPRKGCARLVCPSWPDYRFYAGVPLRTPRGIDIGVFCVFDTEPRRECDPNTVPIMQDLSRTIMGYLETRRFRDGQRRADRMVRGVGSFVQGKSTASDWEPAPTGAETKMAEEKITLDSSQAEVVKPEGSNEGEDDSKPIPSSIHRDEGVRVNDGSRQSVQHIFSKAATIIRESIEADGLLFLDACISSFGGLATAGGILGLPDDDRRSSATSMTYAPGDMSNGPCCKVLGFSTSSNSSIDGHSQDEYQSYNRLPQQLLRELLTQFPRGTILDLRQDKVLKTADEGASPVIRQYGRSGVPQNRFKRPREAQPDRSRAVGEGGYSIEAALKELLPGASNVAFFPLWDTQKRRWYAGGFAWTKKFSRILSIEGELSYLLAFGTVIMADVFRIDAKAVERSKMDVLSSISHELRSPLHGIILGAELLRDTALDAFQGDLLHSMETCSSTLLDTVDHLLDWSGINNFLTPAAVPENSGDVEERGLRRGEAASIESGMMRIVSRVKVDLIVEEVVESVYAGRTFQLRSMGSNSSGHHGQSQNRSPCISSDSADYEQHAEPAADSSLAQIGSDIATICVDIQPNTPWTFHTQPGALRRVVMNLVSNSLKFTTKGFVKVSLDQPQLDVGGKDANQTYVQLTVTDSGCGIGKSYLENDVFTPFIQEDSLKPGMGLGLSFVERIVTALKGTISIESIVDQGTVISVVVPLLAATPDVASPRGVLPQDEFDAQRNDLRGLRVLLLGFRDTPSVAGEDGVLGTNVVERDAIANICRDWLQMQVVEPVESNDLVPDLLLCDEAYLHVNTHIQPQHNASSPPAVVICKNAISARRLTGMDAFKHQPNKQLWEFSAQPVGPRKLAKVLSLTFKRWTAHQATLHPMSPAVQTPMDEEVPRQLGVLIDDVFPLARCGDGTPDSPLSTSTMQELSLPERIRRSTPLVPVPCAADQSNVCDGTAETGNSFLLVDDNPINLKILTTYMKKLKLPYRTATNGQQAVDVFSHDPGMYKCVFMDISMPVMDGFEATRHIRTMEEERGLRRCTIFALTGLASADAQQEAFSSGIDLFLTKPVKLAELSQILSAYLA
ncbi:hypothetical protein E4U42_004238 [Claviceps africana]|uniref:Histidine kinase n=1 Tax=Claviceps africana TaxID=83212 RepID=A0A8K0J5K2_9HYPO|nr:hypothetical protein E4U42_004238 [Claviceps africana]